MTSMTKKRKVLLWAILASAPILMFFGLVLIFPLANLFSGLESLALERMPTQAELIGDYKYSAPWGIATLHLNGDRTFQETLISKGSSPRQFQGSWTWTKDQNSAKVDFRPFGMVWDEDHDREINLFGMNFYKRRSGHTYARVDDDLGEQFERQ